MLFIYAFGQKGGGSIIRRNVIVQFMNSSCLFCSVSLLSSLGVGCGGENITNERSTLNPGVIGYANVLISMYHSKSTPALPIITTPLK